VSEARLHPRLRLKLNADVIGEEVLLACPLVDVSLGGCRFEGPAWEVEGAQIEIVLDFPSSTASLPIDGVVVRASETDMGVRFQAITDEQKWALRKHIRGAQAR